MIAQSEGARLWCRVDGTGPDVLLIHAGVADARMWDGVVAELRDVRCLRFDMRGHGRTTYEAGSFAPARDAEAVLDAAAAEHAVVVGASYGGLVALDLAIRAPERVTGLVLLDALLPDHEWSAAMERFDEAETAALEAGDVDAAVELNVRTWAAGATPEQQALVRDMQARAFALQLEAEPAAEWGQPPVARRLAEIAAPAAVAYGEHDVEDFVAIAHRLARELPGATLHRIQGAGHLPALEQPAAVAALIRAAAA